MSIGNLLLYDYVYEARTNGRSYHTIARTLNGPEMQAHEWARGRWTPDAVQQLYLLNIVPIILNSCEGHPPLPLDEVEEAIRSTDYCWGKIAKLFPGYSPGEVMAIWDWYLVTHGPTSHRNEWLPPCPYSPREDMIIRHGVSVGLNDERISVEVNYDNSVLGLPMRSPSSVKNRRKVLKKHMQDSDSTCSAGEANSAVLRKDRDEHTRGEPGSRDLTQLTPLQKVRNRVLLPQAAENLPANRLSEDSH